MATAHAAYRSSWRMNEILITVGRTIISFIVLLLVTYTVGKHINSHKNHYSFALSVTIGSLIANMAFNLNVKFSYMFVSYITLITLFYMAMHLSTGNRKMRKWISGGPTVLIEEGKVLDRNMKKLNYTMDDVNQLLREKDVFDISQVQYAFLEVSGELSVLKKEAFQPMTKSDFSLPSAPVSLPVEVIMEGEIISKNMSLQHNEEWVMNQCRLRNLQVKDIYYAVITSKGTLYIDTYQDNLETPADVE
jgi:uncharacterized membrane protein YcaP (DUF421 family)